MCAVKINMRVFRSIVHANEAFYDLSRWLDMYLNACFVAGFMFVCTIIYNVWVYIHIQSKT